MTLVHDWTAYSEISERKCDLAFVDAIYYAAHVRSTPHVSRPDAGGQPHAFLRKLSLSLPPLNCANEVCVS